MSILKIDPELLEGTVALVWWYDFTEANFTT